MTNSSPFELNRPYRTKEIVEILNMRFARHKKEREQLHAFLDEYYTYTIERKPNWYVYTFTAQKKPVIIFNKKPLVELNNEATNFNLPETSPFELNKQYTTQNLIKALKIPIRDIELYRTEYNKHLEQYYDYKIERENESRNRAHQYVYTFLNQKKPYEKLVKYSKIKLSKGLRLPFYKLERWADISTETLSVLKKKNQLDELMSCYCDFHRDDIGALVIDDVRIPDYRTEGQGLRLGQMTTAELAKVMGITHRKFRTRRVYNENKLSKLCNFMRLSERLGYIITEIYNPQEPSPELELNKIYPSQVAVFQALGYSPETRFHIDKYLRIFYDYQKTETPVSYQYIFTAQYLPYLPLKRFKDRSSIPISINLAITANPRQDATSLTRFAYSQNDSYYYSDQKNYILAHLRKRWLDKKITYSDWRWCWYDKDQEKYIELEPEELEYLRSGFMGTYPEEEQVWAEMDLALWTEAQARARTPRLTKQWYNRGRGMYKEKYNRIPVLVPLVNFTKKES